MARTGSGVGSSTRVPLRGFSKLFTKLPTGIKSILERAFEEAENLMDFHHRSVPQRQNRRRISGLVDIPVVTATNSIFGGSIEWTRTDDPRIDMYEVQVDTVNVFPNPTSFQVLEPFFAIEGLTTARFLRVRAIRYDGDTGNWSNTVTINPNQDLAPVVFTNTFYQSYTNDVEPDIENVVIFGGEPAPKFYLLYDHTFRSTRNVGGMAVFGYISNRLRDEGNSNIRPWDRIRFCVNEEVITEGEFCHWTDAFGDADTTGVNPSTGDPLSFYGRGGYTAAFGPYTVLYPQTYRAQGGYDPKSTQNHGVAGTTSWLHTNSVRRPAPWDRTALSGAHLTGSNRSEEAQATLPSGNASDYIRVSDFGFKIPTESTVTGIQFSVKRRQANLSPGNDFDDLSVIADSANLHHLSNHAVNITRLDDVFFDATQGMNYVEFDGAVANEGLASAAQDGSAPTTEAPIGFGSQISLTIWAHPYGIAATGQRDLIEIRPLTGLGGWGIRLFQLNKQVVVTIFRANVSRIEGRYTVFPTANSWQHLAVTFDGTPSGGGDINNLTVYRNGAPVAFDTNPDNTPDDLADGGQDKFVSVGCLMTSANTPTVEFDGRISQIGVWSTILDASEVQEISQARDGIDLRANQGDYISSGSLEHYWLLFPGPPDITDKSVLLIDDIGVLRTDLSDKALSESWPKLTNYNADGSADGTPHDSPEGIGYQVYGEDGDLWGGTWTPAQINSFYFGLAVQAENRSNTFAGPAYIDHISGKIWYTDGFYSDEVRLQVFGESMNQFYIEREVYGAIFNGLEVGEIL